MAVELSPILLKYLKDKMEQVRRCMAESQRSVERCREEIDLQERLMESYQKELDELLVVVPDKEGEV